MAFKDVDQIRLSEEPFLRPSPPAPERDLNTTQRTRRSCLLYFTHFLLLVCGFLFGVAIGSGIRFKNGAGTDIQKLLPCKHQSTQRT